MSNMTRGGVVYNLEESPYRYNVNYAGCSITFVFSSDFYRTNFIRKFKNNRKKINQSLSNRFGFLIENDLLSDIKFYISIEKRGFLIYQNGERFECLRSVKLDGQNLIKTT